MPATKMNEGLNKLNKGLLNSAASGTITLHLFTNVYTPTVTDVFASNPYTEFPSSNGYAAVPLTGASWTAVTSGGTDTETFPSITFTFTANALALTIYGYFLTVTVSSVTYLVAAQNFASSYLVPAVGGQLVVNLTETLS